MVHLLSADVHFLSISAERAHTATNGQNKMFIDFLEKQLFLFIVSNQLLRDSA